MSTEKTNVFYTTESENELPLEYVISALNIPLNNRIVMYGTIQRWDGIREGYKILARRNVNEIFSNTVGDYVTFWDEDGDIHCEDIHHDGTNNYIFRELKPEITDYEFEEYVFEHSLSGAISELTTSLRPYFLEERTCRKEYGEDVSG